MTTFISRVCASCHQPVAYMKAGAGVRMGTRSGRFIHVGTGHSLCRDENGERHDCNTKTIPVMQWEPHKVHKVRS